MEGGRQRSEMNGQSPRKPGQRSWLRGNFGGHFKLGRRKNRERRKVVINQKEPAASGCGRSSHAGQSREVISEWSLWSAGEGRGGAASGEADGWLGPAVSVLRARDTPCVWHSGTAAIIPSLLWHSKGRRHPQFYRGSESCSNLPKVTQPQKAGPGLILGC